LKVGENIQGHVFCSFLALVLRKKPEIRLNNAGHDFEWADIKQDLSALKTVTIEKEGKRAIRTECRVLPRGFLCPLTYRFYNILQKPLSKIS